MANHVSFMGNSIKDLSGEEQCAQATLVVKMLKLIKHDYNHIVPRNVILSYGFNDISALAIIDAFYTEKPPIVEDTDINIANSFDLLKKNLG